MLSLNVVRIFTSYFYTHEPFFFNGLDLQVNLSNVHYHIILQKFSHLLLVAKTHSLDILKEGSVSAEVLEFLHV